MFGDSFIVSIIVLIWSVTTVHSQSDGDIRLVGYGSNPLSGRLEIRHGQQWGTVCGRDSLHFDLLAASVVCRQLGLGHAVEFYSPFSVPELKYRFGVGSGAIFLDGVVCNGRESHLLRCHHGGLGQAPPSCQHHMDIAIVCSNVTTPYLGAVRLVGGDHTYSGTVQLYARRKWAWLCGEGAGPTEANAVCRQLGYTAADSVSVRAVEGAVWAGSSPLTCSGPAPCITDCMAALPVATTTTGCPGNQVLEVQCVFTTQSAVNLTSGNSAQCSRNHTPTDEGTVRLRPPPQPEGERGGAKGTVEVFIGGAWGSLCDVAFGYREADVICKQLGFPSALRFYLGSQFGEGSGEIFVASCGTGVEGALTDCTLTSPAPGQCNHTHDVAVECSNAMPPYGSLTLRGGAGSAGGLHIFTGEDFQPICDAGFGPVEVGVACRQLGYGSAITLRANSYYGSHSTPLFPFSRSCSGMESNILLCPNAVPTGSCRAQLDEVGVQCGASTSVDIRLVAPGGGSGRVEVRVGGVWGTVCLGGGFDRLAAHVTCRQLGYSTATDVQSFGGGSGPIHFTAVSCTGFEESLFDCQHSVGVEPGCSHQDDAGVYCSNEDTVLDGTLRLENGTDNSTAETASGRLEVSQHGLWMAVCGGFFGSEEGDVACRALGFEQMVEVCIDGCFGEGGDFVFYAHFDCHGEESSLLDCGYELLNSDLCPPSSRVGLTCRGSAPTTPPPPSLPILTISLAAGLGGGGLLLLVIICVVCCCCCVYRCRKAKTGEGSWQQSAQNGATTNGQAHIHAPAASYNPTDEAQAAKMAAARETYDDPMTAIELQEGHSHRRHSPLHQEGDVSSPPPQYDDLVFLPTTQTSSEAK